ncbi:MAG TPA: hypothetical protein PKK00_06240 [Bacteroidales bacterium]|nr:hypothetical protein [Bacteroidales bacterium]HPS16889.1 hypothetical protein [Bacteroidales bacterium]
MINKENLNVIHDDNLETLLHNLGLLDKIKNGEIKCKFCSDKITIENINGIFPQGGDIKISCDKPKCVKDLSSFLNDKL